MEAPAKRTRTNETSGEQSALERMPDSLIWAIAALLEASDSFRLRAASRRLRRVVREGEWRRLRVSNTPPERLKKLTALVRAGGVKLQPQASVQLQLETCEDEKKSRTAAMGLLQACVAAVGPAGLESIELDVDASIPLDSCFQGVLNAVGPGPCAAALRSLSIRVLPDTPAPQRAWEPDPMFIKARLTTLSSLEALVLPHALLSERAAENVAAACPRLRRAELAFSKAAAVGGLAKLPLEELSARLGRGPDAALEVIAAGPAGRTLRRLRLAAAPNAAPRTLSAAGLRALRGMESLERIDVSGLFEVDPAASYGDLAALGSLERLAALRLALGWMGPGQMRGLAEALRTARSLTTVDLLLLPASGADEGELMAALAEVVQARPAALHRVELHAWPPLSPPAAQALAACPHLSALRIEALVRSADQVEAYAALSSKPALSLALACAGGRAGLAETARARLAALLPRAAAFVP